jgi:hypothetical protein
MDGVALRTGPLLRFQLRIELPHLHAIDLNDVVGHPVCLIRRLGSVFDVGICHAIAPFVWTKLNSLSKPGALYERSDSSGAGIDVAITWLDAARV